MMDLWVDVEMVDELQCEIYGLIKHLLDALVREGNPNSEQDRCLWRSLSQEINAQELNKEITSFRESFDKKGDQVFQKQKRVQVATKKEKKLKGPNTQ